LINYYFGGKRKVYLAVLEHVYAEIRQAESLLDLDHLAPVDAIRRIVQFTFDYYLGHEGFVRLVVAENQAKGRHFRKSKAMRSLNRPVIETLARVIARGQVEGLFRADAVRWKSTRSWPLSYVQCHETSTPSVEYFNATWEPGETSVGGREMVAEVILSYLRKV